MVQEGIETGILRHGWRKLPVEEPDHIVGREVQNSASFFSLRGTTGSLDAEDAEDADAATVLG